MCYMETNKSTILNDLVSHVYTHVRAGVHAHTCTDGICVINTYRHIQTCSTCTCIQSLVLYTCMCVYMYCTADLGIKQTFTYTTLYVCLYDRVALPKGTNQNLPMRSL
jgi:hypothetical protein